MAELADALDSGSSESNFMQVQVLFPAPGSGLMTGVFFVPCSRSTRPESDRFPGFFVLLIRYNKLRKLKKT